MNIFFSSSAVQSAPEENAAEDEVEERGGEEEEPMLAPRVKVAEDGSLIIDEERWEVTENKTQRVKLFQENNQQ